MIVDFHTHVDDVPTLGWHLPVEDVLAQLGIPDPYAER